MESRSLAYARLEPRDYERNLQEGITARIHDPFWFLARQWQMGEFQGENASSPVWLTYHLHMQEIDGPDSRFDPKIIPAEAIVESEIDDWWTMGRRIRIGRQIAAQIAIPLAERAALQLSDPPPPYEHFVGAYDGLALWRKRTDFGITAALFGATIPPDTIPAWNDLELIYQQTAGSAFELENFKLQVQRHRGGRLDWYSVDAMPPAPELTGDDTIREVIPAALEYPGAPNSRWWTIEHHELDVGAYVPDSAHTPTAILTDLIFSHSDDWFLFPVPARAGHAAWIDTIEVADSFGRPYLSADEIAPDEPRWPGLHPPIEWDLLRVDNLPPQVLLLWHVAELPLESLPLERVQFGSDEESNVVWAVEQTLAGRDTLSQTLDPESMPSGLPINDGKPSGQLDQDREFTYVPGIGMAPFWHPYVYSQSDGQHILTQHRLADLSLKTPKPFPPAAAEVLRAANGATHQIDPVAIPSNGIEIARRWNLARDMNGLPVLWIQRQRSPLMAPPARRLLFDVMEEALE